MFDPRDSVVDFCDSAALISVLDLVITVDSAVAHLAGGLGVPVWLLLPWNPDWRWMQDREKSSWYPSVRLFRQTSPNKWTDVINDVIQLFSYFLERGYNGINKGCMGCSLHGVGQFP